MKIILTLIVVGVFGAGSSHGQHLDYDVDFQNALSDIPVDALVENDAITLLKSSYFKVDDLASASRTVRTVVAVMNPDGRDFGYHHIYYDDLRRLGKVKVKVYDKSGKVVKKLSKKDHLDISATGGQTLYDDSRLRIVELGHDEYPYTVDAEWEWNYNGIISWPDWRPQTSSSFVRYSHFEVNTPSELPFRVYEDGVEDDRKSLDLGKRTSHVWTRENIDPILIEEWGPSAIQQIPALLFAPVDFQIAGASGRMDSWANFGDWYNGLSAGRDVIPQQEHEEILAMVDGLDRRDVVRTLYEYMQSKTRYVSVQLGLGGWQPFDAIYVGERGYGDCKALTNYMFALLKLADIEAYPALIKSGNDTGRMYEDFPCNQFNHVILFVPDEDEDIWLECTSQTIPFGELTASTEDRPALVIEPGNSRLIRTPKSTATDNLRSRRSVVEISRGGDASVSSTTSYQGNMQDRFRSNMTRVSDGDRIDYIRSTIDLPSFDLDEVDLANVSERNPLLSLSYSLQVPNYASVTGRRMFIRPNVFSRWTSIPPEMDERTQPVDFQFPFSQSDTTRISIPAGYSVESQFANAELSEEFGTFQAEVQFVGDQEFEYVRTLKILSNHIEPERYEDLRAFLQAVAKSDRSQIVLVKSQ